MKWLVRSLPILITAALLLAVEGAMRLFLEPLDPVHVFWRGGGHAGGAEGAATFMGDPDLGWKLKPGLVKRWWEETIVTTTRDGFRADHEFPRPKRGVRVICAGDSVTFGYHVPAAPLVADASAPRGEAPYPAHLERLLRERLHTAELDVVPMGVPGYTTHQGRIWLEREIDSLEPDLVTILYGFNDTSPGPPDRIALSTTPPRRWARRVVYSSQALTHLLRGLEALAGSGQAAPAPYNPRVTTDEYLENIRAMVELARSRGAKAVVIGQIYREVNPDLPQDVLIARNRRALERACREWGVPYLEVPELTEAKAAVNSPLFVGNVHPSARGHLLLAQRLLALILEDGLLGPYLPEG